MIYNFQNTGRTRRHSPSEHLDYHTIILGLESWEQGGLPVCLVVVNNWCILSLKAWSTLCTHLSAVMPSNLLLRKPQVTMYHSWTLSGLGSPQAAMDPDTSTIQTHISLRIDCGRFSQNVFSHVACLTLNIVKKLSRFLRYNLHKSSYKRRKRLKKYPPKHLQLI